MTNHVDACTANVVDIYIDNISNRDALELVNGGLAEKTLVYVYDATDDNTVIEGGRLYKRMGGSDKGSFIAVTEEPPYGAVSKKTAASELRDVKVIYTNLAAYDHVFETISSVDEIRKTASLSDKDLIFVRKITPDGTIILSKNVAYRYSVKSGMLTPLFKKGYILTPVGEPSSAPRFVGGFKDLAARSAALAEGKIKGFDIVFVERGLNDGSGAFYQYGSGVGFDVLPNFNQTNVEVHGMMRLPA